MKRRTKAVLLALIAVVALILVIALLRGCQQDSAPVDPELPMDTSPLIPGEPSAAEPSEEGEKQPNIDPETGMELEEDELPIISG